MNEAESHHYAADNGQVGLNLPPPVVDPDDPLLIAQTLTYVTDDGSVLLSFTSAPFSFGELLAFWHYYIIGCISSLDFYFSGTLIIIILSLTSNITYILFSP